jgi:hypothetical protein
MADDQDKGGPMPIFESYVYDFIKPTGNDMSGEGGGRPGQIGGPVAKQDPKYRVLTYQYIEPKPPDIENT